MIRTKIQNLPIKCDSKVHTIVWYHLKSGDALLDDSLNKGADLAGKVNINDPSGLPRDLATRVAKCSGGIIAEKIFNDFFDREVASRTKTQANISKIELHVPPGDHSKGQVDFVIRSKASNKTILTGETRSSFSYKTASIENVVRYAMSLLGPYVTSDKPSETTKDVHVTVIHRTKPEELLNASTTVGIDSYIVGGGTKQMFLDSKLSETDDLYQRGAKYRIIKPMHKGLDAYEIVSHIIAECLKRI